MPRLIKTYEYGTTPNSYDVFKAVALLAMVVDHVGYYLMPEQAWLRVVGRLAFPVFLFLVGYSDNFRFNRWLLVGALVVLASTLVNGFAVFPLYILFSILLWRGVMGLLVRRPHILRDLLMLWVALLAFYLPSALLVEYGTLGMMFAVLGWHTRQGRDDLAMRIAWLFTALFWIAIQVDGFGFDKWQAVAMLAETMLLMIALKQFRLREVPLHPLLNVPVILCARNTLLLYVLHIVAFQFLATLLWPEYYDGTFRWFNL